MRANGRWPLAASVAVLVAVILAGRTFFALRPAPSVAPTVTETLTSQPAPVPATAVARQPDATRGVAPRFDERVLRERLAATVDPVQRDAQVRDLARQWAKRDLAGAVAWLTSLAGADRESAADEFLRELAREDSGAALLLAQALPVGLADGRAEHIAQLWLEQSPVDAIAWIAAQPAGIIRDRLLARAAYVRVRTHPDEALRLLETIGNRAVRDTGLADALGQLQLYDPARAASWRQLLGAG